ncbi:alpha/beta hydrolase [Leptolyngbya cf. ectocarpi LEGE 11479]|uniref:Alpha/beta hydrolase n=1 Tax=Leptolyngbya cf. ectocarpi LEGE 11479 TaxID=1828722 RepID=A0A928WXF8_LEPEC|nr:alpha/beta hydrolase [Leptolyngbya ectocarpi]MBE9065235.1 alpha/beta hydrolase [Leptolyngbya cf. ectocarpi LEGE 11479]
MKPKALPVVLRKFIFRDEVSPEDMAYLDQEIDHGQDNAAVRLSKIGAPGAHHSAIPGYFVMSSAPPNIEDAKAMQPSEIQDAAQGVAEIASYLYEIYARSEGPDPELTIAVHGYNSGRSSVRDWYKNIFQYINRHDLTIPKQGNQVFIGYRWPSENIEVKRLGEAFRALPPLPRDLMFLGFLGAFVLLLLELLTTFDKTVPGFAIALFLAVLLGVSTIVLTLVILRMVVYFRDRYRAQNFGVLDLVELLRQIDRSLVNMKAADIKRQHPDEQNPAEQAAKFWQQTHRKVKLSFLGHSMGGFVVTNVVRILSDVFDSRSIGNQPPADVGSVFRLERLILTSPDIPVLTVVSSRVNFLSSSLRRFAESYLFSSEGDLALRVASATANYFTFPSSSEAMGYRLGNISLKTTYADPRDYGIVNLADLDQNFFPGISLEESVARSSYQVMEHLFLTYSWWFGEKGFNTLAKMARDRTKASQTQQSLTQQPPKITVADFFTYFDCTDYKDVTFSLQKGQSNSQAKGLLTRANRKKALGWWDYLMLAVDGLLGKRDVHGGYFQGQFTQEIIYRIAFLGFTGYLETLDSDPKLAFDPHVALSKLHMRCRDLGIQSFLSPFRYRVNIKGENITHNKQELIEAIDQEASEILQVNKTAEFLKSQGFDVVVK